MRTEAAGKDKLVFPDELDKAAPKAVAAERSLYDARARKLAQDIDVVAQQETQRRRELDEYRATEVKLTETLKLLQREVDLTRNLFQQKVVPEIEMLRVDRQASEMRGQIEVIKAVEGQGCGGDPGSASHASRMPRPPFAPRPTKISAKSRGDLAVLDENIKAAKDRVFRTDLRSPVHGIVNKLNVTTIGAVVQPGANVMDIVPLDDTLLIEGRIKPQDIALHPRRPGCCRQGDGL